MVSHGEDVANLHADFEAAIDFMIEDCKTRGIPIEKPSSGKLMLRIPPELHAAALVKVQSVGKSLNQWAIEALSREVGVKLKNIGSSTGLPGFAPMGVLTSPEHLAK